MKTLEESIGLRSMDEALRALAIEEGDDEDIDVVDDYDPFSLPQELDKSLALQVEAKTMEDIGEGMLAGQDTENRLDVMHDVLMGHADTLAKLAMELDPGKAPRAFEVLNGIVKNAMDAVNSKRDHQLKTMRLILDKQKFDHSKTADSGVSAAQQSEGVIAVMTTADLVRSFRKAMDDAPVTTPRDTPTPK